MATRARRRAPWGSRAMHCATAFRKWALAIPKTIPRKTPRACFKNGSCIRRLLQKWVLYQALASKMGLLYQGTTSVVPFASPDVRALAPEGKGPVVGIHHHRLKTTTQNHFFLAVLANLLLKTKDL